MSHDFTKTEHKRLSPFVSNMDKPVFVLKNLPQEVAGAVFSRYSRSEKSVRRLLLDEFLSEEESGLSNLNERSVFDDSAVRTEKARNFFARILAGYGDDSIGELGGVHIAVEDISNIAVKTLEDARIGISPLEKSTRYVRYDIKQDGEFKFYRDPEVIKSRHGKRYEKSLNTLFETYAGLIEPMITWVKEKFPQGEDESDRAYNAMTKAKALDSIRGLLPAATLTNVGLYGNGRSFEYLLTKMYASPLWEIRELAATIHTELQTAIPSLVSRADDERYGKATQQFIKSTDEVLQRWADGIADEEPETADCQTVTLIDYDANAEERALSAALYKYSRLSAKQLRAAVSKLSSEQREALVQELCDQRGNRRQRPGRGFENTTYEFDFLVNYGAYRDLQRHRMLSQDRQWLSTRHGYEVPHEVIAAGHQQQFRAAMDQAAAAYEAIAADFPEPAQYAVPFGYRMRYRMNLTLRELYHLVELRSTPQGHPDYRRVAQEMYRQVQQVHPLLVSAMKFVDLSDNDELERRASEKKIDEKLAKLGLEKISGKPKARRG